MTIGSPEIRQDLPSGKSPDGSVIVRLHGVQGPTGGLFAAKENSTFTRVEDVYSSHLTDAEIAKRLLRIEAAMHDPKIKLEPIYHLSASEPLSPYEIAVAFAQELELNSELVIPSTQKAYEDEEAQKGMVHRLSNVNLDTRKTPLMRGTGCLLQENQLQTI